MSALTDRFATQRQAFNTWLAGLNPRERKLVTWGGTAALVLLVVGGGILPLYAAAGKAAQRVEQKQQDLQWMRSVAGEIVAAGPVSVPAPPAAGGSLIVLIDQSARDTGLEKAITGSQPSGNGGIRVRIESASFDALVGWLALLEQQHAVMVESASVDRTAQAGRVNASLVLRKS